jgi:origin recognition complex subunit 1
LHFAPYTSEQIAEIINGRLQDLPEVILEPDAVNFCAGKVAGQSADVRSALDIMRYEIHLR